MTKALPRLSKYATEKELWQRIKPMLQQDGRKAYRIEAIATPGFPDVVWLLKEGISLIELKAGPLKLRPQQIHFIEDAHALDVKVWVIHQLEKRGDIMVFAGIDAITWTGTDDVGVIIELWLKEMTND